MILVFGNMQCCWYFFTNQIILRLKNVYNYGTICKHVNFKYEKLILESNFNNLYGIYFNIIPWKYLSNWYNNNDIYFTQWFHISFRLFAYNLIII